MYIYIYVCVHIYTKRERERERERKREREGEFAVQLLQDDLDSCPPHTTPYTLHPTPYTLHPTPYTLLLLLPNPLFFFFHILKLKI